MENPFHYTLDLAECEPSKLTSLVNALYYIENTCNLLKLNRIGNGSFEKFPSRNGVPGGVTAFQILSESSLSLHTYPECGMIYIDLYSCRPFDVNLFFDSSREYWGGNGVLQRVTRMKVTPPMRSPP